MASLLPTLSVSLDAYDGYETPQALASLASLGVDRIEPAYLSREEQQDGMACSAANARRMVGWLRDTGLRCHAIAIDMDLAGPDARELLPLWQDYALSIGAKVLLVPGVRHHDMRRALALLVAMSPRFDELGLALALAPSTDTGAMALPEAADLVRRANLPWLGLDFRTAQAVVSQPGLCVADQFEAVSADCLHVHLCDLRVHDGWFPVAAGTGVADCGHVLGALRAHPLSLTLELPLRQHRSRSGQRRRAPYRVPLSDIESAIAQSLYFVSSHLPVSFFH